MRLDPRASASREVVRKIRADPRPAGRP